MKALCSLILILILSASTGCQKRKNHGPGETFEATISATDGVAIAYDVRGSGNTALIFIHGWCSNRTFWREQLDEMAKYYRVVAIDLPGHGTSGRTREKWSLTSFASDVTTVVKTLDLERVVLIGHSMGGHVSFEAARLLPERVIGVVGVDTLGDVEEEEDQPEMMERVFAAFEDDFEGTMRAFMPRLFSSNTAPKIVRWAADNSVNADHVMALTIMRELSDVDEKQLLSSVDVPVRCIYAAPTDPSESRSFVETNGKYADFDAVFVDGVGHFLHIENPEMVNRHLLTFLTSLEE